MWYIEGGLYVGRRKDLSTCCSRGEDSGRIRSWQRGSGACVRGMLLLLVSESVMGCAPNLCSGLREGYQGGSRGILWRLVGGRCPILCSDGRKISKV